jgi:hypothetical protein
LPLKKYGVFDPTDVQVIAERLSGQIKLVKGWHSKRLVFCGQVQA